MSESQKLLPPSYDDSEAGYGVVYVQRVRNRPAYTMSAFLCTLLFLILGVAFLFLYMVPSTVNIYACEFPNIKNGSHYILNCNVDGNMVQKYTSDDPCDNTTCIYPFFQYCSNDPDYLTTSLNYDCYTSQYGVAGTVFCALWIFLLILLCITVCR